MKSLLLTLTLLTLATSAVAADPVEGFLSDYKTAQAQAKKEDKPLYLHFTTVWCTWCRRIEDDIYKSPEGKKVLAPFVKASLDCTVPRGQRPSASTETNIRLMQKYGGEGYPFLVITTPEGEILGQWSGYMPMPHFKKQVDTALKSWDLYKKIKQCQAKGDTKSMAYHKDCLSFYLDTQNFAKAGQAAEALLKLDPKSEKTDPAKIAFARLCAALAAKAGTEKINALQKAVTQSDPKNEKGYLEKAYNSRVNFLMKEGQNKNLVEQQDLRKNMVALLKEMLRNVPNLSNPSQVYGLLFQVQAKLGDFDGAIESLNALKKTAPEGVDTTQIDEVIGKLQEAKQAAAGAKPAETPKEKPAEKKDAPAKK